MENTNSRNVRRAYWCLIVIGLIIIGIFASCGTRRVNKSEIKTEEKTVSQTSVVDNSKTTTLADTNTKVVDLTKTDEIEISPADTSKVMVVNGKTYRNAILKRKKVANNIVADKSEKVAQTEQKAVKMDSNITIEKKSESKTKNLLREQFDWTKIIIVISIVVFLFILFFLWYFGIRRKKNT